MKVILMMAMSIDGKIGRSDDDLSTKWTSTEDTKLFITVTKQAGALIMGRSTYDTFGKPLKDRLNIVLSSTPDDFESFPGTLEYMSTENGLNVIDELERRGYESVVLAGGTRTNDLFLKNNLVDEVYLTIEPIIFGSGLCLAENIIIDKQLKLLDMKKLNDHTVNLHYKIVQ